MRRQKKKYRKIDFEDMLIQCRDLFMKRPDILKKWQEKFQYILVDEFQDVNQAQYDVVLDAGGASGQSVCGRG